jgi:hypothetical protein
MRTTKEKLSRDLLILQAMLANMEHYLGQETLFWNMGEAGMPKLTVGGYLLRQWRLERLPDLLSAEEQAATQTAVTQFDQLIRQHVVQFETRANQELNARLRQWSAHLRDMRGDVAPSFYATAAEVRTMVAHLMAQLSHAPFKLEDRQAGQLSSLDLTLRGRWRAGDFVWTEEWRPAYPQADFWWLYGLPRAMRGE